MSGCPVRVLTQQGVVKLAPNLAWRDVAFRSELSVELASLGVEDLPIFVQNDFDVAALGEYEFGEAPVPDPLIYLGLGVGVGAGVVVRDRLFLGADGFAGEVGHSILQLEGPVCSCGRRGCAEAFIGLRAISTRISGHAEDMLSVETIRRLLDREDEGALLSVKRAGRYLGVLIQNLWMYFNPGRVVIGGPVCELGAPFLDAARSCLEAYAQDCALQLPDIRLGAIRNPFDRHRCCRAGQACPATPHGVQVSRTLGRFLPRTCRGSRGGALAVGQDCPAKNSCICTTNELMFVFRKMVIRIAKGFHS